MKLSRVIISIFLIFFAAGLIFSQGINRETIISTWKKSGTPGNLTITYPLNGTLFPPEFASPTFKWHDKNKEAGTWLVIVSPEGSKELFSEITKEQKWKPAADKWAAMKRNSSGKDLKVTILGLKSSGGASNTILSGAGVTIRTSKDEVGGLIFYRSLPLPFAFARANLETVHWCLGDVSSEKLSPIVLKDMPVCGNCHSFTPNGQTLAMDVDAMDDKGAYIITPVKKNTVFDHDNIITWSDYQQGEPTMGLLSQISPDGRYVVSTLKDAEIFVALEDIEYSNFFFPIKGILVVHDRVEDTFRALPGADDPNFIQSNPHWSTDGKYIIFTRARTVNRDESGISFATIVKEKNKFVKFLDDLKKRKRRLYYDLYRVPFNNGKGGKAEPVPWASHNDMSNFFARYSPDGKWIVFTRAKNFMLLQPDSKLYIMPADGSGKPRKMKCNTSNMNSWHSWSPNSKWLVFSSKEKGPYTQLFLTHIDEKGNDTPPVLLENFRHPKRAANIPEFVNIRAGEMLRIVPKFLANDSFTSYRNGRLKAVTGNYKEAIELYNKAIKQKADFYAAYTSRGDAKRALGDLKGALEDYNTAIKINPNAFRAYCSRGDAKIQLKDLRGALADLNKSIAINNKYTGSFISRADVKAITGDHAGAAKDYTKAIELDSDALAAFNKRALARMRLRDFRGMLQDINRCIELTPKNPVLYFERGFAKTQLKDIAGSIKDFDKAIELNPKYADAYTRKGDAKFFLKDYNGAIQAYSKAIEFKPRDGQNFYKRGLSFMLTGQRDAGCRDLHRARDLGVTAAVEKIRQLCAR